MLFEMVFEIFIFQSYASKQIYNWVLYIKLIFYDLVKVTY